MGQRSRRLPRLMAFLLDLPLPARQALASRWGTEASTPDLYRAMTDPASLSTHLAELTPSAHAALTRLTTSSSSAADLLSGLPVSAATLGADLTALVELGLVLAAPEPSAAPAPPRQPHPDGLFAATLYVPTDVAAALARIEPRDV